MLTLVLQKRNIKISDPKSVLVPYLPKVISAIEEVIRSGQYIGGDEVELFEREFSEYLEVDHSVGTGSGTDAIQLALRALGVKKGDKVATVSHTSVATVSAIEIVGGIPVLVDINSDTFTMNVESLRKTLEYHSFHLSEPIKAIIPVHIYGHPANMPGIMELAKEFNTTVIEDCAQAHGAGINGRKCGTWGHVAAFSFYPTKNLGCLGDGGALITNDPEVAAKARLIKEYGWRERYVSEIPGINTRLDSIQAAVLRVRLSYLDQENERRINIATRYSDALANSNHSVPIVKEGYYHVFHQYVLKTSEREALRNGLNQRGIGTNILYPVPIHMQPAYRGRLKLTNNLLPVSERVCSEILGIPVYPSLTDEEVGYIIESLHTHETNP